MVLHEVAGHLLHQRPVVHGIVFAEDALGHEEANVVEGHDLGDLPVEDGEEVGLAVVDVLAAVREVGILVQVRGGGHVLLRLFILGGDNKARHGDELHLPAGDEDAVVDAVHQHDRHVHGRRVQAEVLPRLRQPVHDDAPELGGTRARARARARARGHAGQSLNAPQSRRGRSRGRTFRKRILGSKVRNRFSDSFICLTISAVSAPTRPSRFDWRRRCGRSARQAGPGQRIGGAHTGGN